MLFEPNLIILSHNTPLGSLYFAHHVQILFIEL